MTDRPVSESARVNGQLRRVVAAGHGVVSGDELARIGLSRQAVKRRTQSGLLVPVLRGVFALPGTRLDCRGRARAAMLAGGSGCVVTHGTALALHGLVHDRLPVHVTKSGGPGRIDGSPIKVSSEFGFRVQSHQARSLPDQQITDLEGIRVVTMERALLEFSAASSESQIGKALAQGERQRVLCWKSLREIAEHANGYKGVGRLRSEMDFFHPAFADADSEPEGDLLRVLRRRSLPMPEVNAWLEPYKVDFYWRHLRLAVELDPLSTHRGTASFFGDRRKSVELEARGLRVIRITGYDLYQTEERMAWELEQIMRHQARLLGVELHLRGPRGSLTGGVTP